ncbi:MAG: hypothetical protein GKR94_16785 [Gammaproteobacteria bacterium]|nr:hypothetical protein [Gammaproteobacteria bacterium]
MVGDDEEVYVSYSRSCGRQHVFETLGHDEGILLSDGHRAYESYAKRVPEVPTLSAGRTRAERC